MRPKLFENCFGKAVFVVFLKHFQLLVRELQLASVFLLILINGQRRVNEYLIERFLGKLKAPFLLCFHNSAPDRFKIQPRHEEQNAFLHVGLGIEFQNEMLQCQPVGHLVVGQLQSLVAHDVQLDVEQLQPAAAVVDHLERRRNAEIELGSQLLGRQRVVFRAFQDQLQRCRGADLIVLQHVHVRRIVDQRIDFQPLLRVGVQPDPDPGFLADFAQLVVQQHVVDDFHFRADRFF